MNKTFSAVFAFTVILLVATAAIASPPDHSDAREVLTYKISYGPLRIGTIRILNDISSDSSWNLTCDRMLIDSNPSLPFVNFHSVYESFTDTLNRSVLFRSTDFNDDGSLVSEYRYDYTDSLITVSIREINTENGLTETVTEDTVAYTGPTYDLLSFMRVLRNNDLNLPFDRFVSFNNSTFGPVALTKSEKRKTFKMDAFPLPRPSRRFKGQLLFDGVAGWSGKFSSWFTEDDEALLVLAKLKVFLGSISVKLENIETSDAPSLLAADIKNGGKR